ncbi:DsbA family protein [Pseudomonas sp. RIT-PI-S]|uniref:DsbA family protein n=1 Tax=Pseudomonas sp. RIT-PI-S TaxID=3035295 RepID=UPI0021D7F30A|nr:DsbA family protein [Pseudomonas sp. RIT-PI-S]
MTDSILHYVHDPLCGWCYAAAPLVAAAQAAGLSIVLHGGGLWQPAVQLDLRQREHIRENDERIAALTGVPFGAPYLNGLLGDSPMVLWSPPAHAAILAASSLKDGAGLAMLHAIQRAHYVEGRPVISETVLTALAEGLGLDKAAFLHAVALAPVDEHIQATRRLMRTLGLRGFPGFILEQHGSLGTVEHALFYGQPAAFARAVLALAQKPNLGARHASAPSVNHHLKVLP